jgi:hypothetical protein
MAVAAGGATPLVGVERRLEVVAGGDDGPVDLHYGGARVIGGEGQKKRAEERDGCEATEGHGKPRGRGGGSRTARSSSMPRGERSNQVTEETSGRIAVGL